MRHGSEEIIVEVERKKLLMEECCVRDEEKRSVEKRL